MTTVSWQFATIITVGKQFEILIYNCREAVCDYSKCWKPIRNSHNCWKTVVCNSYNSYHCLEAICDCYNCGVVVCNSYL